MVIILDVAIDIDNAENMGIYGGGYDTDDEGNLSYHSSDGLDEDDSFHYLSLGDGAVGTSPPVMHVIQLCSPSSGSRMMTARTGFRK